MKAITYSEYGPPEVLRLEELPAPIPKDNELLVRIRAVEATKTDIEFRLFKMGKWLWLPMRLFKGIRRPRLSQRVLGGYFAGEIIEIGKEVRNFSVGDEVFGSTMMMRGCYAELVAMPDRYSIIAKPQNMSFEEAASVPLGGLNALHFMRRANIQPGEKVLINGAGGCIGAWAIQIAKSMGAEVTVVDIGFKEEGLRKFGADYFIDYTKEQFIKSEQRYDVIFDMVTGSSYSGCIKLLKPKGRYLKGNCRLRDVIFSLFTGLFSDKTAIIALAGETKEELKALKDLIEQEKIGSIVDRIYPMEQAVDAHYRVETEKRIGTVVISMQ